MRVDFISNLSMVLMPLLVGLLFIVSYFFADKNEFFHFLAYFPRKREGSLKIGSLIFGIIFVIVAFYNYLKVFYRLK